MTKKNLEEIDFKEIASNEKLPSNGSQENKKREEIENEPKIENNRVDEEEKTSFALYQSTHLLTIGINLWEDGKIPKLKGAVKDSKHFKILFASFDQKKRLINKEATKESILKKIKNMIEKIENGEFKDSKRHLFVIHFAGHGAVEEKNSYNQKSFYIYPYDISHENMKDTGITVFELRDLVCRLENIHCLLFLDCCFAGSSFRSQKIIEIRNDLTNFMHKSFYVKIFCFLFNFKDFLFS